MSAAKGQMGFMILPPELDNEAFKAAWEDWLTDRAARRLPRYTARAQELQLRRMAELGCEQAIKAIEWSIAQGYKGIFAPPATPQQAALRAAVPEPPWAIERRAREREERLKILRAERYNLTHPGGQLCAMEDLSASRRVRLDEINNELTKLAGG